VAAAQGEFGSLKEIAGEFYSPQSFKTVQSRNMAGEALGTSANVWVDSELQGYYTGKDGEYVDKSIYRQSYDIDEDTGELTVPGMKGPQEGESSSAAPITVVPTSSSDTRRPRTVAAGYDPDRGVLTVVFRDGTWYNYYEVTKDEWTSFKGTVSKGKYIYKFLDYKPRGAADTQGLAAGVRKTLYSVSRAYQLGTSIKKGTKGTGKIN
jgi:hypothetical protein